MRLSARSVICEVMVACDWVDGAVGVMGLTQEKKAGGAAGAQRAVPHSKPMKSYEGPTTVLGLAPSRLGQAAGSSSREPCRNRTFGLRSRLIVDLK